MTKRTVIILFLVSWSTCHTQNLVKNPKLEEYYHLPDLQYEFGERYEDSAFICKYWHKVKNTTPDYFHINAKNERYTIPLNKFGIHPVLADSAYIGFIPFDLGGGAEPISGEFTTPLEVGKLYEVSFWYRFAGINSYFELDRIECIIGENINHFEYNRHRGFSSYEHIVTPEMKANVTFEEPLNNNGEWHMMTGYYTAKGEEKCISLGVFYQNEKLNKIINEYITRNFELGQNEHLKDKFYKKYSKYLVFIHRNPDYVSMISNKMLEVTFETKNQSVSYIHQEHLSYYFIDDVSVKEVK